MTSGSKMLWLVVPLLIVALAVSRAMAPSAPSKTEIPAPEPPAPKPMTEEQVKQQMLHPDLDFDANGNTMPKCQINTSLTDKACPDFPSSQLQEWGAKYFPLELDMAIPANGPAFAFDAGSGDHAIPVCTDTVVSNVKRWTNWLPAFSKNTVGFYGTPRLSDSEVSLYLYLYRGNDGAPHIAATILKYRVESSGFPYDLSASRFEPDPITGELPCPSS